MKNVTGRSGILTALILLLLSVFAAPAALAGGGGGTPCPNSYPVAVDDSATVVEDSSVTIPIADLLNNDYDPDGETVEFYSAYAVGGKGVGFTEGTVTDTAEDVVFVPTADFFGTTVFGYTVKSTATSDTGGVTCYGYGAVDVTVEGTPDEPVATADAYAVKEDHPLELPAPGVLANDRDADNVGLVVSSYGANMAGSLTIGSDGALIYIPPPDFTGIETFNYSLTDGLGRTSTADGTITVNETPDGPQVQDDTYAASEDTVLSVPAPGILGNDYDGDGTSLSVTGCTGESNGEATVAVDGSFTYAPALNFHGSDSFWCNVSNQNGKHATELVVVNVAPVNDFPRAADDVIQAVEDGGAVSFDVRVNDTDVDGDTLTVASYCCGPYHGALTQSADGTFTYVPNPNYSGGDSFYYQVSDPSGYRSYARVSISVAAVNDGPTATLSATQTPGNPLEVRFSSSGSRDPDGYIASYSWDFGDGTSGTGSAPRHTYPDTGTYAVTLTVTDNGGTTAVATGSVAVHTIGVIVADASIAEGDKDYQTLTFTVQLSEPSNWYTYVDYRTSDGTATANRDYWATAGTITIPSGQTSATVSVRVLGDNRKEPNETFSLVLSNLRGNASTRLADSTAIGTILTDD